MADWNGLGEELKSRLGLEHAPLAITFSHEAPASVERVEGEPPPPLSDGRTGKVPAGCVFWIKAADGTFATAPEDHANCSVGSLTHGLQPLSAVAGNGDVSALVESGWVGTEMFPQIPTVAERPNAIVYGPLAEAKGAPDVVFIRLNGKQVMLLHDAWPGLRFEGKPQCHIIPIAKEQGEVAVSVGCMLSRVRTGMSNNEITCAIPWARLPELIEKLRAAQAADQRVAIYAADDSKRFS